MIKIEIWASGSGSNAERLIEYFKDHPSIEVAGIMTNSVVAGVIERATRLNVPYRIVSVEELNNGNYLATLRTEKIDYIILAGFLKLVPSEIVSAYENRIINVHPSLLPKYGGKNMYGNNVHIAVLQAGDSTTGITIHLVNEKFDDGRILAQFSTAVDPQETLESLLPKIRRLEHKFFPIMVEDFILTQ